MVLLVCFAAICLIASTVNAGCPTTPPGGAFGPTTQENCNQVGCLSNICTNTDPPCFFASATWSYPICTCLCKTTTTCASKRNIPLGRACGDYSASQAECEAMCDGMLCKWDNTKTPKCRSWANCESSTCTLPSTSCSAPALNKVSSCDGLSQTDCTTSCELGRPCKWYSSPVPGKCLGSDVNYCTEGTCIEAQDCSNPLLYGTGCSGVGAADCPTRCDTATGKPCEYVGGNCAPSTTKTCKTGTCLFAASCDIRIKTNSCSSFKTAVECFGMCTGDRPCNWKLDSNTCVPDNVACHPSNPCVDKPKDCSKDPVLTKSTTGCTGLSQSDCTKSCGTLDGKDWPCKWFLTSPTNFCGVSGDNSCKTGTCVPRIDCASLTAKTTCSKAPSPSAQNCPQYCQPDSGGSGPGIVCKLGSGACINNPVLKCKETSPCPAPVEDCSQLTRVRSCASVGADQSLCGTACEKLDSLPVGSLNIGGTPCAYSSSCGASTSAVCSADKTKTCQKLAGCDARIAIAADFASTDQNLRCSVQFATTTCNGRCDACHFDNGILKAPFKCRVQGDWCLDDLTPGGTCESVTKCQQDCRVQNQWPIGSNTPTGSPKTPISSCANAVGGEVDCESTCNYNTNALCRWVNGVCKECAADSCKKDTCVRCDSLTRNGITYACKATPGTGDVEAKYPDKTGWCITGQKCYKSGPVCFKKPTTGASTQVNAVSGGPGDPCLILWKYTGGEWVKVGLLNGFIGDYSLDGIATAINYDVAQVVECTSVDDNTIAITANSDCGIPDPQNTQQFVCEGPNSFTEITASGDQVVTETECPSTEPEVVRLGDPLPGGGNPIVPEFPTGKDKNSGLVFVILLGSVFAVFFLLKKKR